jgi:glutamine synthetase
MAQVESRARATSDPEARREALKRLQDENVDFLLLWFTDIEGHLKSFAVTPSEVEEALNDGMGFDGSSITGFNAIEESDMVAIPDPEHVPADAVARGRDEGRADDLRHRHARREAVRGRPALRPAPRARADAALGFDTFNVGPELEYFLFRTTRAPRRSTRAATSR